MDLVKPFTQLLTRYLELSLTLQEGRVCFDEFLRLSGRWVSVVGGSWGFALLSTGG